MIRMRYECRKIKMGFSLELIFKIALTLGGILAVVKGVNDGFVSNKSIEQASWVKLVLGFILIFLGIFLIYFADLFPPVTKFLRPLVQGILGLPEAVNSWIEHSARKNIYR